MFLKLDASKEGAAFCDVSAAFLGDVISIKTQQVTVIL